MSSRTSETYDAAILKYKVTDKLINDEEFADRMREALFEILKDLIPWFDMEWANKDRIIWTTTRRDYVINHFRKQYIQGSYIYMNHTKPRLPHFYPLSDTRENYYETVLLFIMNDDKYFDEKNKIEDVLKKEVASNGGKMDTIDGVGEDGWQIIYDNVGKKLMQRYDKWYAKLISRWENVNDKILATLDKVRLNLKRCKNAVNELKPLSEKNAILKEKIRTLQNDLEECKKKGEAFENENGQLVRNVKQLKETITTLENEKTNLTQKAVDQNLLNMETLEKNVELLEQEKYLREEIDTNKREIDAVRSSKETLKSNLENQITDLKHNAENREEFISNLNAQNILLKESNDELTKQIDICQQNNDSLNEQMNDIKEKNLQILEENKNILEKEKTLINQISKLGLEKEALESQLLELKQQNDKQVNEIQKLIGASEKVNEEKRILNENNENLQKEITILNQKNEGLSAQIIALQESSVANSMSIEELKEKYLQSLTQKNDDIDSKKNILLQLEIELKSQKKKLSDLEEELSTLEQKVEQQQIENNSLNTLSTENKKLADEYNQKNQSLELEITNYKLKDITLQLQNENLRLLQQQEESIKTYQINEDLSDFVEDLFPVKNYKKIGQESIEKLKKHLDVYRALVLAENDKLLYTVQNFTAIPKYVYYERPVISIPIKSKIKLGKMLSLGDVITRNYYKQIATETSTGNYMISIDFYQANKQRTHALQIKNVQARAIGVDSRHELVCHFSANKSLIGYAMIGPMGSDIVARQGLLIMRIANEHGAVRTARYFYNVAIPETSPKFGVPCLAQLDGNDKLFVTYCSPSYIKLETLVVGLSSTI